MARRPRALSRCRRRHPLRRGTIDLQNPGSQIYGYNNSTLDNMDNTIQGQGNIAGLASFQNDAKATVDTDVSGGTLTVTQVPTTNTGTIEAQAGATLNLVSTTLTNFAAGALGHPDRRDLRGATAAPSASTTGAIPTTSSPMPRRFCWMAPSGTPNFIDQNGNNALAQFATNGVLAGNFTIQNGVSVTTASSDFDNAGTINLLPGTLNVGGSYTQESTGTLGIGLGRSDGRHPVRPAQRDRNGHAGGDLQRLPSVSSYQPLPGNMYQVVNFASKTGNFNTYNGLQIGPTLLTATFLPANNPTNLTLNGVTTTTLVSIALTPAIPAWPRGDRAVHRHRHLLRQLDPEPDQPGDVGLGHDRWRRSPTLRNAGTRHRRSPRARRPSRAALGAVSGTDVLTVTAATLLSIALTPASPRAPRGGPSSSPPPALTPTTRPRT